ncbi:hypothetical protein CPB86DRAFT_814460 [Serendipita vermifera]|nr:hypothetical protein CPB86DRAFT_814460 [Serendipita vermifera]
MSEPMQKPKQHSRKRLYPPKRRSHTSTAPFKPASRNNGQTNGRCIPSEGRYAISDALQPSVKGSHAFHTLERRLLGLVSQKHTGPGHGGRYYHDFHYQSHMHVPMLNQSRPPRTFSLRAEALPNCHMGDILDTKKGIEALAVFLRRSSAFRKPAATQQALLEHSPVS